MSRSNKSDKVEAKDIRRGVLDQPAPVSGRKGGKKPYRIVGNFELGKIFDKKNSTIAKFAKRSDAEKALAAYSARPYYENLRIEGPEDPLL